MKKNNLTALLILSSISLFTAQVGIGLSQPNSNAMVDITSTNKGLLLPRIPLIATNNPSPLTAHVAGMTVYNTATNNSVLGNEVSPGQYYNDGTKWFRVSTSNDGPKMLVGGDIADALTTPTSLSVASNVNSNTKSTLTTYTFTLTKPSIVDFNANISSGFYTTSDGVITDGSVKIAGLFFSFSSAPAGVPINTSFGYGSMSYTNTNLVTNNGSFGAFYIPSHAILTLPAGDYTVNLVGMGTSARAYKLVFSEGSFDSVQIKATPI